MLLLLSLIGFFSFFFFILKWLLLPRPSPLFPPPNKYPKCALSQLHFGEAVSHLEQTVQKHQCRH
jgi:hypothetical protein